MDIEKVKKSIEEAGVLFDAEHLERWAEVYRSFLIDELYATQKVHAVLAWLKSDETLKLSIDKRTISEAADTLVKMACIRHNIELNKSGERDYISLGKGTQDDSFGGMTLCSIICVLDRIADALVQDKSGSMT